MQWLDNSLKLQLQKKTNKLSTNFEARPYRVIGLKGNSAVLQHHSGQKIMRNVRHIKKYVGHGGQDIPSDDSDLDDVSDLDLDIPDIPDEAPAAPPVPLVAVPPDAARAERPQRIRRPPRHLDDFIV